MRYIKICNDCGIIFNRNTNSRRCKWCLIGEAPSTWNRAQKSKQKRWLHRRNYVKMMELPQHQRIEMRLSFD